MAIVSAEKFVQAARDNGYAVGGFNTNNLEWTQAILRAAEAKKAPVLIQTSMGAAKYMGGYKVCKSLIENLVESMGITVPVAIHLDHGHYEDALECIEVGYTSIMFDGSHLPVEENLKLAKEVVEKAHAKGISWKLKLVLSVAKKTVSSVKVNWLQSKTLKQWLQLVLTSWQQVLVTSTALTQQTGKVLTLTT